MLLPDWLARSAANYPDKLALRCEGTDWSFVELDRQATRLTHRLAAQGVRAGDRVALLAANGLPFAACMHALTRLGAVLVPLNTRLTPDELRWQLADVRASLILHDATHAGHASAIPTDLPRLSLDDVWFKMDASSQAKGDTADRPVRPTVAGPSSLYGRDSSRPSFQHRALRRVGPPYHSSIGTAVSVAIAAATSYSS